MLMSVVSAFEEGHVGVCGTNEPRAKSVSIAHVTTEDPRNVHGLCLSLNLG